MKKKNDQIAIVGERVDFFLFLRFFSGTERFQENDLN